MQDENVNLVTQCKAGTYVYYIFNRIKISSNCVELIFGKGNLSTLGASRDAVFWLFFLPNISTLGVFFSDFCAVTEEDPQGRNVWQKEQPENCVTRRSQSQRYYISIVLNLSLPNIMNF